MELKAVSGIMLTLLLVGMLTLAFNIQQVKAEPATIVVPDDYEKIQWAIGNASDGDTIFVRTGTYYENLVVNKTISLVGECMSTTVIDGRSTGTVIHVFASGVSISGFTIRNVSSMMMPYPCIYLYHSCGSTVSDNKIQSEGIGIELLESSGNDLIGNMIGGPYSWYCIRLRNSNDTVISENIVGRSDIGIELIGSSRNIISRNLLVSNMANDVALSDGSNNNFIIENALEGMISGLSLEESNGNTIYRNNFVHFELDHVYLAASTNNTWDNGYPSGGNYWSRYTGNDTYSGPYQNETGSDGIGDTPYIIDENNQDNYPFMSPLELIPPLADAGPDKLTYENKLVRFNGSRSLDNVGIVSYEWDFGDGTNGTGMITEHTYTELGTYIVTLTVWDAASNNDNDSMTVTVKILLGDANDDGCVNIWDLGLLSDAWLTKSGDPDYNPNTDFNEDGIINIWDLGIMSDHWLE